MENDWLPYCEKVPVRTGILRRPKQGGVLLGGSRKAVAHKTQCPPGADNAQALYGKSGFVPHFTISDRTTQQHLPISTSSFGLKNAPGNVETNRGGKLVVQIEIAGYSGVTMSGPCADRLISVQKMLRDVHGIPWQWPSGRPLGNGAKHNRSVANWTRFGGWYSHSQVPENFHWDPAYTDLEWYVLNLGMEA